VTSRRLLREVLFEQLSDEVCLLGGRRVVGEPLLASCEVCVGDDSLGPLTQGVDPAVAHTVTELLLLTPQNGLGEVALEGLTHTLKENNKTTQEEQGGR
jgi:hypothetical protein